MTFVGMGQQYLSDELLHVIHLDSKYFESWNAELRKKLCREVDKLSNVLSCIARTDRRGEFSITVPANLSEDQHRRVLIAVVRKLQALGLHEGPAEHALKNPLREQR